MKVRRDSIVLSHSGKQHSYHVAKALLDLGHLQTFYTSSYIRSLRLQKLLLKRENTFWTRRFIEGLGGNKVVANWHFEFREQLYARLFGKNKRTQHAVYLRDEMFDQYMANKLSALTSDIFWGFQGSCYASLRMAQKTGKFAIVELATAHVSSALKILSEEERLHPDWRDSFDNLVFKPPYRKRLEEEPFRADMVIAASRFTRKTLLEAGLSDDKIYVLPLGFDASRISFNPNLFEKYEQRPLKLLYAGRITQRKGIKYLLEAVTRFSRSEVELHIIGYLHGKGKGLKPYRGRYQLHAALSQYELFQSYRQYDALVIPSVFEGFGLVIVEAMAAGLPVIATPHTMGPDVIIEDKNGYIVPIRDVSALEKAIGKLAAKTPEEFYQMRLDARDAAMGFTWDDYKGRLKMFLNNLDISR